MGPGRVKIILKMYLKIRENLERSINVSRRGAGILYSPLKPKKGKFGIVYYNISVSSFFRATRRLSQSPVRMELGQQVCEKNIVHKKLVNSNKL